MGASFTYGSLHVLNVSFKAFAISPNYSKDAEALLVQGGMNLIHVLLATACYKIY